MQKFILMLTVAISAFAGGYVAESTREVVAAQEQGPDAKGDDEAKVANSIRVKKLLVVGSDGETAITLDGEKGLIIVRDSSSDESSVVLGRIFEGGGGLTCSHEGKIRAMFAASKETSGFGILDSEGNVRMEAHVSSDGHANGLMFSDSKVRGRLIVGCDASGNGSLKMYSSDQSERVSLGEYQDGGTALLLSDAKGHESAKIVDYPSSGPEFILWDEQGKPRAAISAADSKDVRLLFMDEAGKEVSRFPEGKPKDE